MYNFAANPIDYMYFDLTLRLFDETMAKAKITISI